MLCIPIHYLKSGNVALNHSTTLCKSHIWVFPISSRHQIQDATRSMLFSYTHYRSDHSELDHSMLYNIKKPKKIASSEPEVNAPNVAAEFCTLAVAVADPEGVAIAPVGPPGTTTVEVAVFSPPG